MHVLSNVDLMNGDKELVIREIKRLFVKPVQKLLLVNPPSIPSQKFVMRMGRNRRYFAYPPYGLGVLSHQLRTRGYQVELLDLNFEILNHFCTGLEYRATDPATEFDVTDKMTQFLADRLARFSPDVVAVTCMFTMHHEKMLEIAAITKAYNPAVVVVAGGVHPSNAPNLVLEQSPNIDFVGLYESDKSFPDLIDFANGKAPESAVCQLATRSSNGFVAVKERNAPAPVDMDVIPDYLSIPIERYSNLGDIGAYRFWWRPETKAATVLSNRGCRAHCSFCSVANFNGQGVRGRSVDSVIRELEILKKDHGINHIMWLDDDLFFNQKRAIELFETMAARKLDITWDASNGVIASATTAEVLDAAAKGGCIGLHFGVESGNSQILKEVHKPSGVKHFLRAGELLKKHPQIFSKGFLIIGFPNETIGQMLDTVNLAVNMDLDWYTVQVLTPLPSTEIYWRMVEMGLITPDTIDTGAVNYGTSQTGRQHQREQREQLKARDFDNFFQGNLGLVPTKEMMDDLWFLVDYKINYERILNSNDPVKLKKWQKFLCDVSQRMTTKNPLSNFFLGVVESKLGNHQQSSLYMSEAKKFVEASDYWQRRFETLELTFI